MEDFNNIENIDEEIKKLKMEKQKLKQAKDRKLRLRSNNCGKSNVPIRVSLNFQKRIDYINSKRDENGLDCLSGPKITELIVKHKRSWRTIQNDITRYNTSLDSRGEEFNDK